MKKMILAFGALVVLVVAGASCGGGSNGSCTITTSTYTFCEEFLGSSYTSDSAKAACTGTFTTDSCPTTGSLGTCDNATVASAEYKYTYYTVANDAGTGFSTADAKTSCTAGGGTFTSP